MLRRGFLSARFRPVTGRSVSWPAAHQGDEKHLGSCGVGDLVARRVFREAASASTLVNRNGNGGMLVLRLRRSPQVNAAIIGRD
jgi:hypothetical protein